MSINSKPNAVRGGRDPLLESVQVETVIADMAIGRADAPASLPAPAQLQRTVQMYQLATIFASIFEALEDKHAHAIATTREAA